MEVIFAALAAAHVSEIITMMLGLIISMLIKDVVANAVVGIRIKMSDTFNPGDHVYIDGEYATIISQDYSKTIFQIQDERGTVWRYVYNSKFRDLNIAKVVEKK